MVFEVAESEIKGSIKYFNAPTFEFKGAVDGFLANSFYIISDYSNPFMKIYKNIANSISGFGGFQLYPSSGLLLGYNSTKEKRHAGFWIDFVKTEEDLLKLNWGGYVYGDWWNEIYYVPDNMGQIFLNVLTEPNGLYVVPIGNTFYLISKAYPNYYFKVN